MSSRSRHPQAQQTRSRRRARGRGRGRRLAAGSLPKAAWADVEFLRTIWTWMTDEEADESWDAGTLKQGILSLGKHSQDKLIPWLWRAWQVEPETKRIFPKGRYVNRVFTSSKGKKATYKSWVADKNKPKMITRREQFLEARTMVRDWWAAVKHERKASDLPPDFDSVAKWAKDQHGMFEGPKTGLPLDPEMKARLPQAFDLVARWKDGTTWRRVKKPIKGGKHGRHPVEVLMEIGHVQAHCYLAEGVSDHYTQESEMCVLFDKNEDPRCTFEVRVRKDINDEYTWQIAESRGIYNIFPVQKWWPYIASMMGVKTNAFKKMPPGFESLPPNAGTGEPPRARDPRPDGVPPLNVEAWAAGHYRKPLIDSIQATLDKLAPEAKAEAQERDERLDRIKSMGGGYSSAYYGGSIGGFGDWGDNSEEDSYWAGGNWRAGNGGSWSPSKQPKTPKKKFDPNMDDEAFKNWLSESWDDDEDTEEIPRQEWIEATSFLDSGTGDRVYASEVVWKGSDEDEDFDQLSSFMQIHITDEMPSDWKPVGIRRVSRKDKYGEITVWVSPFYGEKWKSERDLIGDLYVQAMTLIHKKDPAVRLLHWNIVDEKKHLTPAWVSVRGFASTDRVNWYKFIKPPSRRKRKRKKTL